MPNNARLTWDEAENRKYEYGVSQGVLFPMKDDGTYDTGKPWNGLTNVTDQPEGADINKMYADGIYYAGIRGAEEYHAASRRIPIPTNSPNVMAAQPLPGMYVGQQARKVRSFLAHRDRQCQYR